MSLLPRLNLRLLAVFLACAWVADGATPAPPVSPPQGIAVPAALRAELEQGVEALGHQIDSLRTALKAKPALLDLLPDVQIFHNAVRYALADDIFYRASEFAAAQAQLKLGMERAAALQAGQSPWTTASGLVVRGFVSRIDGSVQPYGLVIPDSFHADSPHRHRLDVWFHGRANNLSEVAFLADHLKNPGQFTPPDTIVLHPYGRYCNANRFAGEVDFIEALAHVKRSYRVDDNRVVVRGFSMGGAACWQFACHYAWQWAAAAPGAGFTDTPEYTGILSKGTPPPWYEQKLWHLYDCPEYAVNLSNVPVVAYTGGIDTAMPCTLLMEKAMATEGMKLVHIIGPQTGHKYHPDSKELINQRIDAIAARGREPLPGKIRFATWTLRYNQMGWVTVDAMAQHWQEARVEAGLQVAQNSVSMSTKNVTALSLAMESGRCPFDVTQHVSVVIDGQNIKGPQPWSDRSWTVHLQKAGTKWTLIDAVDEATLRKRHGLQGPIDDAFTDDFVMVHPTGQPMNEKTGRWTTAEEARATKEWHRQFRGEASVIRDDAVTAADIAAHNLILWGDPQSNKLLARIAGKLPVRWTADGVQAGSQSFATAHHVPVMIFPNPLNPKRYIVLNSGFTFREDAYGSNASQTPKLPDYAVIDVDVPATAHSPGGVVAVGFFDEQWQMQPQTK